MKNIITISLFIFILTSIFLLFLSINSINKNISDLNNKITGSDTMNVNSSKNENSSIVANNNIDEKANSVIEWQEGKIMQYSSNEIILSVKNEEIENQKKYIINDSSLVYKYVLSEDNKLEKTAINFEEIKIGDMTSFNSSGEKIREMIIYSAEPVH